MKTTAKIDLSLVIPCYNEGEMLKDSVKDVFEVLDNTCFNYEIIFIDDCSRDNTSKILDEIVKSYPEKKLIKFCHEKNTGRGQTVVDGIKTAKGEIVGFIDIDLEVHARYIPSCVLAVKNGADIATAHRIYKFFINSLIRYFMSRGYTLLVKTLLKVKLKDTETGFKFFNRLRILPVIEETRDKGWFWDTEIMVRSYLRNYRIKEIPVLFLKNPNKRSTVNNFSDSVDYFIKLLKFRKTLKKELLENEIKQYWQNKPERFFDEYISERNFFVKDFLLKRLSRISRLLKINNGTKVIDVGCGTGALAKVMLEKGACLTGADYSLKALSILKKDLNKIGVNKFFLINCNATLLPLSENKFDLLVSVGLLDYIDNINKALMEFKRVVKPNGKIIFTVPKSISPFFILRTGLGKFLRKDFLGLPSIKTVLSKDNLKKIIDESGLKLNLIESFYMTMWIVQCEKKPT